MATKALPRPKTHGRRNAAEAPAYFLAEAAHYLHLPTATVRSWALGRRYPTEAGTGVFAPLIAVVDPARGLLSFLNLVELHVISSVRRVHKLKLKAVRRAIDYLRKKFPSEHPLIDRQMLTNGKDLFVEQYGELVNISEQGQLEMKIVLDAFLKRIRRDEKGIPIQLFPFTRPRIETSPEFIAIDPRVCFGKPCIAGTGIPTRIIAERHEAGDSIALLAEDYGRPTEEIEEALRYESRAAS